MGYSYFASKPNTLHTNNNKYSSPTFLGALSLQTPLAHYPPSSKGDSDHLITHKTQAPTDPCESFSPNSVIYTWELIDGLKDELDFEMEESFLSKLDPNVVSSYRSAFSSRKLSYTKKSKGERSMGSSHMNSLPIHCYVLKEKAMNLLQVFIRGKHIGGVEEVRQLNETDPKLVCESCGDARFLPCPNCHGSREVFDEEEQLRIWFDSLPWFAAAHDTMHILHNFGASYFLILKEF
ncbi:hypothetical protein P3X46_034117 [Hevea brasiliensis]|uniref:Glutaredoxin domain-containing protein n=1 Tax=Hevea brasiliensis TaxID=3981 RepID=A0ABQ9KBX8_HEVBR|nr:hypothetical protein P3X46_034117 [Hevea brasiliensis]